MKHKWTKAFMKHFQHQGLNKKVFSEKFLIEQKLNSQFHSPNIPIDKPFTRSGLKIPLWNSDMSVLLKTTSISEKFQEQIT